ncbi:MULTISPECIES: HU family DNA-binding protein [Niveibacterium]|nr:HU family DNA-binding protein [Niveibacterium microcysteis]
MTRKRTRIMNKSELIDALAAKTGFTKTDSAKALDGLLDVVTETLAAGDEISLVGFGSFSVSKRAARTGRNPKTGEAIQIAASKAPTFSAGAKLKAAVNK